MTARLDGPPARGHLKRVHRPLALALGLSLGALVTLAPTRLCDAQPGGGERVVARVGDQTITVRELERRLAQLMPWQVRTYGTTPDEVRKRFLDQVLVRELLLAQGARDDKLAERPDVAERVRGLLRNAVVSRVRADTAADARITDDEVKRYYEQNRAKFTAPQRLSLWRILVATKAEAEALLAEVKKDSSPKRWQELARERSLDKLTHMRGGNLGFVSPDGTTGEPGVTVDPAVVAAALKVSDAEIVPEPVPEEGKWAVVWRRQSTRAVERGLEQEAPAIRQTLAFQKIDGAIKGLLADLRKQHLTDYRPELADRIEISAGSDVQPARRPGALPTSRKATPQPTGSPSAMPR